MTEGLCAGADLSYTRSAIVWLNADYTVADKWARPIPQGPMRLKRAFAFYLRQMRTLKPRLVVIEDNCHSAPNAVVTAKLVALNSMFKLACEILKVEYLEISPSRIKKTITGRGNADKHVVAQELARLYGIKFEADKGYDWSDAAACAVYGLRGVK